MISIPDHLVSLSKDVTSDQEPAIGSTGSGQTGISSELNDNVKC